MYRKVTIIMLITAIVLLTVAGFNITKQKNTYTPPTIITPVLIQTPSLTFVDFKEEINKIPIPVEDVISVASEVVETPQTPVVPEPDLDPNKKNYCMGIIKNLKASYFTIDREPKIIVAINTIFNTPCNLVISESQINESYWKIVLDQTN